MIISNNKLIINFSYDLSEKEKRLLILLSDNEPHTYKDMIVFTYKKEIRGFYKEIEKLIKEIEKKTDYLIKIEIIKGYGAICRNQIKLY